MILETLLKKFPVQSGDFVFVPSGTVHVLNKVVLTFRYASKVSIRLSGYRQSFYYTGNDYSLENCGFKITFNCFGSYRTRTIGRKSLFSLIIANQNFACYIISVIAVYLISK